LSGDGHTLILPFAWLNIVIELEKVGRIILGFQGRQARMVGAISGLHTQGVVIGVQMIHIDAGRKRRHCLPKGARPIDILLRRGRVGPLGDDVKIPQILAVGKGRGIGRCASFMLSLLSFRLFVHTISRLL
jgi:hypothetical protein